MMLTIKEIGGFLGRPDKGFQAFFYADYTIVYVLFVLAIWIKQGKIL